MSTRTRLLALAAVVIVLAALMAYRSFRSSGSAPGPEAAIEDPAAAVDHARRQLLAAREGRREEAEARALLEEVIRAHPGTPHALSAHVELVRLAAESGDTEAVADAVWQALEAHPDAVEAVPVLLLTLGRTLVTAGGDPLRAAAVLGLVVDLYPDSPQCPEAAIRQALALASAECAGGAVPRLLEVHARHEGHPLADEMLFLAARLSGSTEKSTRIWQRLEETYPGSPLLHPAPAGRSLED
jgi:hypothetical protein